jgi:hypothetical protein
MLKQAAARRKERLWKGYNPDRTSNPAALSMSASFY